MSTNLDIEHRKSRTDFDLQFMDLIYDRSKGIADVPHRHDYYTVLLVEIASGEHTIDFIRYPFNRHQCHFISPGQVHQVNLNERPSGSVITFSRDFLVDNNIPEVFITNINLFKSFGHAPPLQLDDHTFRRLKHIMAEMRTCMPEELNYRNRALGALLQLFLIYCNNANSLDQDQLDEEDSGICMLRDFKNLVERNYHRWHKVSDYSREIYISSKHLSHTVKKITGKTAKTIIQERIILEVKRLLLHTDLFVKEIAKQLGFEEPLHLSSFFKKSVGISPTEFRESKKM